MPTRTRKKGKSAASEPVIDSSAEFEQLLKTASLEKRFVLRLYVTGNSVRSGQAIANIRSLCEEYLPGRYDLSVVDIYQQPTEAAREQIIAAPTLVKELPSPPKRLIGDLSDRDRILLGLNLVEEGSPSADETRWLKL